MEAKEKAVGYVRVSTKGQAKNGLGLGAQRKAIERLAKEKGLTVSKFYEDKGLSGRLKDRPGLKGLIRDVETDSIGYVLVYSLDRLARDMVVSLFIEQKLKKFKVSLITVLEQEFDLDDPTQKLMKRMREVFSEFEGDIAGLRTETALTLKVERGEYPKGVAPLGFEWTGEPPHRTLRVCRVQADMVRDIFRCYLEVGSLSKVQRRLSSQFTRQGLAKILKNRFYLGKWERFGVSGRVDRLIDPRIFNKVQRLLESKRKR